MKLGPTVLTLVCNAAVSPTQPPLGVTQRAMLRFAASLPALATIASPGGQGGNRPVHSRTRFCRNLKPADQYGVPTLELRLELRTHGNDRDHPDRLRRRQPGQLRRKVSSIRLGWLAPAMHDGGAALHRRVDRQASGMGHQEVE